MINEDNQTEIIELYLQGELEGELLAEVEKRLQEDADFREQVALEKEVLEGLDALALDALQKDLDEIHEAENIPDSEYAAMRKSFEEIHAEVAASSEGKSITMQPYQKTYWRIAAVVALLIVSGIAFFIVYQPSDKAVLAYVGVQEADPDGNASRGGITDTLLVMIYPPTEAYNYHYQLSENLKLYGDFNPDDLKLYYNKDTNRYFLEVDQHKYAIEKQEEISRLE